MSPIPHPTCQKSWKSAEMPVNQRTSGRAPARLGRLAREPTPASQASAIKKGRAFLPAPSHGYSKELGFKHSHDLERSWIHHDDLVAHQEVLIPTPLRIDRHDLRGQGVEAYLARNAGSDRDREVDVLNRLNMLLLDHAGDLGALLGCKLRASAGLARRSLGPGLRRRPSRLHAAAAALSALDLHVVATFAHVVAITALGVHLVAAFAALGLHVVTAFAALGLHLVAAFAAFGLHVVTAFATLGLHLVAALATLGLHVLAVLAAFSLHVLAALGTLIIRAHALGLLHVLAALTAARCRFLIGLGGLLLLGLPCLVARIRAPRLVLLTALFPCRATGARRRPALLRGGT